MKGHLTDTGDCLAQEIFSGGKPPDSYLALKCLIARESEYVGGVGSTLCSGIWRLWS